METEREREFWCVIFSFFSSNPTSTEWNWEVSINSTRERIEEIAEQHAFAVVAIETALVIAGWEGGQGQCDTLRSRLYTKRSARSRLFDVRSRPLWYLLGVERASTRWIGYSNRCKETDATFKRLYLWHLQTNVPQQSPRSYAQKFISAYLHLESYTLKRRPSFRFVLFRRAISKTRNILRGLELPSLTNY